MAHFNAMDGAANSKDEVLPNSKDEDKKKKQESWKKHDYYLVKLHDAFCQDEEKLSW